MSISWSQLSLIPCEDALQELTIAWSWLIKESYRPILFSVLGDMFYEPASGGVWWLNTGTGEISQVATTAEEFQQMLGGEMANEWFLPHLVEQLYAIGKIPGPGYCYSYITPPIFKEGTYEASNFYITPAKSHFSITGHIHKEVASLPDGSKVQLVIEA